MEDAINHIVEPLSCAVNAFSQVNLYPGDSVIVFGAGYMGLLLIQFLAQYPLRKLVVVDMKPFNLNLAKQLGANEVIDISKPDGVARLEELQNQPFDIAYEGSGAKEALDWCTKLATAGGTVGIYAWHHDPRLMDTNEWHMKGLKVLNVSPQIVTNERMFRSFEASSKLMGSGRINQEKLITHRYSLDEIDKGMKESALRQDGFVKSIIVF
jgi:L-iditol 2-dehydrogenase